MARISNSAPAPHVRYFQKRSKTKTIRPNIIQKFGLISYGKRQPVLQRAVVESWSGCNKTPKRPMRKARYLPDVQLPAHYAPQVRKVSEDVIAKGKNGAIAWDKNGRFLFFYLRERHGKPAISRRVQAQASTGLQRMIFTPCDESSRPELKGAIRFNDHRDPVAGEINLGWMSLYGGFKIGTRLKNPQKIANYQHNAAQFQHVEPLLEVFTEIFRDALPAAFARNNTWIKTERRMGNLSPFSTLTLLRSAPSAVHVDQNNEGGSLAVMTTLPGKESYKGGTFCFPEYAIEIGVKPGDILIAATPSQWHTNIERVVGEKYSVIAYFKRGLRRSKKPTLPSLWKDATVFDPLVHLATI
jgi:hypothetical protein